MKKIYLNILGLKNFEDDDLKTLEKEVNLLTVSYNSPLYEPIRELGRKIRIETGKRERRKWVWVEFTCSWSGYSNNPSAPRRNVGRFYKKLDKDFAERIKEMVDELAEMVKEC